MANEVIASDVIASELQLGSETAIEIEALDTTIVAQSSPGASPVDIEPAAPADRSFHAIAAREVIEVPQAPTLVAPEHAEAGESAHASTVTAQTDEMVTTQFIEVWRPVRRDEHARGGQAPRRRRTRRSALPGAAGSETAGSEAAKSEAAKSEAAKSEATTSAEGQTAPAGESEASSVSQPSSVPEASSLPQGGDEGAPRHGRHGRRDRREPSDQLRSPRTGRPDGRQADARTPRADRAGRQRSGERPDRPPRGDRPDRDPALRAKYIKGRGDSGAREQEPDPNSPFAKLAKLKEQLEASSKEPR
jgi:ATP-dependent RNA helicase SUPV3L1/SUV3